MHDMTGINNNNNNDKNIFKNKKKEVLQVEAFKISNKIIIINTFKLQKEKLLHYSNTVLLILLQFYCTLINSILH